MESRTLTAYTRLRTPAFGHDTTVLDKGISWLRGQQAPHLLLVLPGLSQLQTVDELRRGLGGGACDALAKKPHSVRFGDGRTLHLMTRRIRPSWPGGSILAAYLPAGELDAVERLRGITSLLVVPWIEKDVEAWTRAWLPAFLGGEPQMAREINMDPVVEAALRTILRCINKSTGFIHPNDKGKAVEAFQRLHAAGILLDPEGIDIHLRRAGLDPEYARDGAEFARKVVSGSPPRYRGGPYWRENILEIWRDEAAA